MPEYPIPDRNLVKPSRCNVRFSAAAYVPALPEQQMLFFSDSRCCLFAGTLGAELRDVFVLLGTRASHRPAALCVSA